MDVIYLTGGKGIRANLGFPKQYAYIAGKPILIHGLEILSSIKEIKQIIIPSDHVSRVEEIIKAFNLNKCVVINGGDTRQESVYEGLKKVDSDFVLIAEAVRPFITKELIYKVLQTQGNVIPYTTLNSTPFDKISGNILNRNRVVMVQTPQKYITRELKESHEFAISQGLKNTTDDLDLMKKIGICGLYNYIEGPVENIKITYPVDLKIAEAIYNYKNCIDE